MSKARIFKKATLCLIIVMGVYAMLPEAVEEKEQDKEALLKQGAERDSEDVKYTIRYSPGAQYTPGARPYGMGEPIDGLNKVVAKFETLFPDTRIEMISVPSHLREYLVTQLSSGAAPDVIRASVEDVWVDIHKNWYIPLDQFLEQPNQFVRAKGDPSVPGYEQWWDMFKYQALTRGKAGPDGKSYCLTLDAVETGIFYNKTIFEKYGLEEPKDFDEFFQIMDTLKENGITPLNAVFDNVADWGVDLVLDQMYYDILPGIDVLPGPNPTEQEKVREEYLQGYLDGIEVAFLNSKGFFTKDDPRFAEIWKVLHKFRGYMGQELASPRGFTRDFIGQDVAMVWSTSLFTYRLVADKGLGFEWGVFYPPPLTKNQSKYAGGHPMCVIGGAANQLEITNSAISDTDPSLPFEERIQKSERLKRVLAFLQFLSLPENADIVTNEYPRLIANIKGVEPRAELKPFEQILEERYTTTKWAYTFDLRFLDIHQRMLALYLEDGIDLDGFLDWQERNVESASNKIIRRQGMDWELMENRWQELAPLREGMIDLPPQAREEGAQ